MHKLFKKRKILIIISAIVLIITVALIFSGNGSPKVEFVEAKRMNLVQEVSITGRVKSAESVDLAFEKIGRISRVYAEIGDLVKAGASLVSIDSADLQADLAKAEASAKSEEAKLKELIAGTRPEEISIQEVKVLNAKTLLEEARKNLADKIDDAYTKADDAIRNKTDQFFTNPKTSPQLTFTNSGSPAEIEVETRRLEIEKILANLRTSLDSFSSINEKISFTETVDLDLFEIKTFLDKVSILVNELVSNSNLSQTTIDGWKADISTARTNVNTAINNISSAKEKLSSAESSLKLEKEELALKIAGATPEQILAQEAKVDETKAAVQNIFAQLSKTIIRSPINGVVTKQEAKVGQVVSANVNIVSVISESKFEVEVSIPEADVSKLKLGNSAKITLDAYTEEDIFEAKVIKIDPAETIIEGVPTYKTTLEFINEDSRIKSGMTANINIITEERPNVITIPQRAIIRSNGEKLVRLFDGKKVTEVKVETGISGSDGNIEVVDGVEEGNKVVISLEE